MSDLVQRMVEWRNRQRQRDRLAGCENLSLFAFGRNVTASRFESIGWAASFARWSVRGNGAADRFASIDRRVLQEITMRPAKF